MQKINLKDGFIGGWFIGNFEPTIHKTKDFEIGLKKYKAGDFEKPHKHLIATEATLIIEGKASMNGVMLEKNDIVILEPGEVGAWKTLEDVVTIVIKYPSVIGDKYDVED